MSQWADICSVNDILPNMGRCALFEGKQVAIFKVISEGEQFFAIDNYCPFAEANVLSRGLVGSVGDKIVVASPVYKQHFCLDTGECIEDEGVKQQTFSVRVEGDKVQLMA